MALVGTHVCRISSLNPTSLPHYNEFSPPVHHHSHYGTFYVTSTVLNTNFHIQKITYLNRVTRNLQGSFALYETWHNDDGRKIGEL